MASNQAYLVQWLPPAEVPLANKFYRAHGFRGSAKRHEPCAVVRDKDRAIIACGYVRDFSRVQGLDKAQGSNEVRGLSSAEGFNSAQGCNEFKLLAGVAVDPAHQGGGVARLLLAHLSDVFDAHTYTFPYRSLVPFYTSLGFQSCELVVDKAVSDQPSPVYELYQRYRDQGRDIAIMVYMPTSSA